MIDKLDLRIPAIIGLSADVADYIRAQPSDLHGARIKPSRHYVGRADLRPIGVDALLHISNRHNEHEHKLEILDVGKKPYSEITKLVEAVTTAPHDELGVMRIDLTADVRDVPVEWFRRNASFHYKRQAREYGELPYNMISKCKVETITAGVRPNFFRIYDKTAENQVQLRLMQRRASKDADALDYVKIFGEQESAVITRVERQCVGKGIPAQLSTFESIVLAAELDPFARIVLPASKGRMALAPADGAGMEYYTALGLLLSREQLGMQGFRKQLNLVTHGNGARTLKQYAGYLANQSEGGVTSERLREIYRESTIDQLSA